MTSAKRFKKSREYLGLTQQELAEKLDFKQYKIKDIETEKQKVSPDIAELIEKNFSISGWWLLTGKGEMLLSEKKDLSIEGNDNITLSGHGNSIDRSFNMKKKKKKNKLTQEEIQETISIPYLQDTYAAAGHGAINYDEVPHPMSFDKTFLQRQFGIVSFENLHIINAIGNSMEPTLKEGELLLVNPFENENMHIKDGGIYIITTTNGTLVKRVHFNPISGEVTLKSDNKDHKDMPITKTEFESCRIVGRVVGHFDKI